MPLNFSTCIPLNMVVYMLLQLNFLPKDLVELIANMYGGETPLDQIKEYMPFPTLTSQEDKKYYMVIYSPFREDQGEVYYFQRPWKYTKDQKGEWGAKVYNDWVKIELQKLTHSDLELAQLVVQQGYWETAVSFGTPEERAFACFFGALGGNVMRVLRSLETLPPFQREAFEVFAVLGYTIAACEHTTVLPPLEPKVIKDVETFLGKNNIRAFRKFVKKQVVAPVEEMPKPNRKRVRRSERIARSHPRRSDRRLKRARI